MLCDKENIWPSTEARSKALAKESGWDVGFREMPLDSVIDFRLQSSSHD